MKNKLPLFIGLGVVFLGVLVLCVAAVFFIVNLGQDNTGVIEYNNATVDSRDQVITDIRNLTVNFGQSSIVLQTYIDSLEESIASADETINNEEVPDKGQEIKDMNIRYLEIAEDMLALAQEATEYRDTDRDTYLELAGEYDQLLIEISQLNIDIANKLNDIVGYNAVPENDINSLQSQHDELEESINNPNF